MTFLNDIEVSATSIPIFAINLDGSRDRWDSLVHDSSTLGVSLHRIAAINGHDIKPEDWTNFDRLEFERRTGRHALNGEYGCYRSHLLALQTFLDHGAPYGVIIEDDILLQLEFVERVNAIINVLPDFDVIKLVNHRCRGFIRLRTTSQGDSIGRAVFGPQGSAAAYLVSRDGAGKILNALSTMSLPWDVALERFWASQIEVFSTKDNIVKFSNHKSQSTIVPSTGYKDTKFEPAKRIGAFSFKVRDFFLRAHNVLLPPYVAALEEHTSDALSSKKIDKLASANLGSLATLIFLSAIWFESDAYRFAGLAMVLAALIHYFKTDLYMYTKPLIGWVGLACVFWTIYVLVRMAIAYNARPGLGFGAAEGIYLIPLLYPTFGYALFLFVRRPFEVATAFMAISMAVLAYSTDYYRIFNGGRALASLHNNPIHAANASGFILICAIAFGSFILRKRDIHSGMRKALLMLASTTLTLAGINIVGLFSKGVWFALAISLLPLFAFIIWGKGTARIRNFILIALILIATVAGLFQQKLMLQRQLAAGEAVASSAMSLVVKIVSGNGLAVTVSEAIADPSTARSVTSRLMIWANAAEVWARRPIFGSGIAWLDNWENRKYTQTNFNLLHNGYLEIAVRYGITGLIFYTFLFVWSLATVRKAAGANLVDKSAYYAHLAAMIYFSISLFTNSNNRLAFGETYMWFAVSFGFYCLYLLQERRLVNTRTYI